MDARIYARVAVAEACTGDMNCVRAEVDRAARVQEVVDSDAALRVKFQTLASALGPSLVSV